MRTKFLNIEIDNLKFEQAVEYAINLIKEDKFSYVVTPNVDHIVQIESNRELKKSYENASLILTDGKPLIWISKVLRINIKDKISGSDFFPKVLERAADKDYSVFLLGAKEGVAQQASENLTKKYQGLKIAGYYSPPFGFEKDDKELKNIINIINESGADILAVGLGAPKQEIFLYERFRKNDLTTVKLAMGIGASIDFEANNIKRAPKWMSDTGLEWFYRTIQEPKRMARRYGNDFVKILPIVWKNRKE